MGKQKKRHIRSSRRSEKDKSSPQTFYTPFESLGQHLAHSPKTSSPRSGLKTEVPAAPAVSAPPGGGPKDEDMDLFLQAMSDVKRLEKKEATRLPAGPAGKKAPRFLEKEELEAYAHLVDLVAGEGPFELTWSDEYVDGAVVGLSPVILKKLRCGDFCCRDFIDLHGLKKEEAREVVIRFIRESFAERVRCVLIIPGRGLNSKDKQPVLKEGLVEWLTRAPLKRIVLAFASARSCDGGAGALYVLLRKNEDKTPLVTPAR